MDAKFYVYDENHRHVAWMRHIQRLYSADIEWILLFWIQEDELVLRCKSCMTSTSEFHFYLLHSFIQFVFSLFLYLLLTNFFCFVRRCTENSHVKMNLVHTLYCVRKYGSMPIDKFNKILSAEEMQTCKQNPRKTWYSMPLEVFTTFIYQVIVIICYLFDNYAPQF